MLARATPDLEKWAGDVVMQEVPFNAGQILRFNTWLKIPELSQGETYVEVVFASNGADLKMYTGNRFSSKMDYWTQTEVEGMAPAGTTKAKLKLVVLYEPKEGTGVVCFDDISAFVQQ